MGQIADDDPEVKKCIESNATAISELDHPTSKLIGIDWHRLKRAVAVFLRTKKVLQARRQARFKQNGETFCKDVDSNEQPTPITSSVVSSDRFCIPLSAQGLAEAEIAILKFVQSTAFRKEIMSLNDIQTEDERYHRKLQRTKEESEYQEHQLYLSSRSIPERRSPSSWRST